MDFTNIFANMGKDRNTVAGEVQQALIKKLAKRLAYRFGSAAKEGSGLTARGFIDAFKEKREYDELGAYLYGPESVGMEPFYGKTNGPSHESMIGTRDAREYRGLLNPDGEYVFPASVQSVLEQAANVGSNIYINADHMPYTGEYRYDAANHPVRITRDDTGALVGSAADLYDFDPGYLKRYDAPAWQVIPMAAAGTPYIVRQDNIPIRFVGDNASEDDKMKASMTMEAWGSGETPHRKKKRTDLPAQAGGDYRDSESIAIENTLLRSGMPILEPATVMAEYPGFNQYGGGGGTGEIRPSKPSNVVQRYLSDHPMTGHRLRKAGVLAADLARVFPGTSFLMDLYDSKRPKTESDRVTNPLGAIGRGTDIITNTVREAGEAQPSIRRILRGSPLGKLISLPDLVSDSAQFIRDFSEPVEHFDTGGLLRRFDDGGDTEEEYYDTLNASSISSKLPSINTEKGKRYAKNMAKRVVAGDMKMSDVPGAYKTYVEGEVRGAMPVRNAINTTGVKTALGTLAVPVGIIAGAELGVGIATNPILRTAFDIAGSADGIRNAVSDNGVKKTARLVSEGNYGRAALSGLGDAFDIIGGVGLARDVYRYGRGVAKRGAEAVLRMGDAAANIPDLKRQFGDKSTLNYVFNPFADSGLAYKLPFKYSGESAIQDDFSGAHFGDIVDQYLGKADVPDATYDTSVLPEYLQRYIANNYPNKKIPIRDLGNAGDTWQEVVEKTPGGYISGDSPAILKDGVAVLDPGGFVSQIVERVPAGGGYDNVTLKNWDIWKFNDKDYVSRHSSAVGAKDVARRLGLKFLDSQGTPIVHTWTSHGGYAVSPEVVNAVSNGLAQGGNIHIKPSHRGRLTELKERTGKTESELYNDGNPAHKKMVVFARNSRKWHGDGGPLDLSGIKTTNNRPYNADYISYIDTALRNGGMNDYQRASVLANIIEESGGNPFAEGPGGFYGLLQWSGERYPKTKETDVYKEIDNQVNNILATAGNSTDKMSWTHGGKGSGYNSFKDAMDAYNGDKLEDVMRGYTLGYVRPAGGVDSYNNRMKVARQLYDMKGFRTFDAGGFIRKHGKDKILSAIAKMKQSK